MLTMLELGACYAQVCVIDVDYYIFREQQILEVLVTANSCRKFVYTYIIIRCMFASGLGGWCCGSQNIDAHLLCLAGIVNGLVRYFTGPD